MKIIVVNVRKRAKYLILGAIFLVCLIMAVFILPSAALSVSAEVKDLPIYSVDSPDKTVAITFDCAWGSDDIPAILDTLEKENVKASFFIVGQWAEKFPDKVRMIAAAGHDVANHSYSHLRMGAVGKDRIKDELNKCGEILGKLANTKVDLFRPPYGDYSNSVVSAARELGYYTIQWDVDSLDWKPDISKQEVMNRVTTRVKNGSIILFHNDTAHTAAILPDIISVLKKEGYGFLPVSKLILRENFIVNFEGRQMIKD